MINEIKEKIIKENYRITKEDALALFDQPLEVLAKAANEMNTPSPVMMRMGLMLRLVMPSKASASIFFRG